MPPLKNIKTNVSIDPDTLRELDEYAASNGLKTANTLLAAAGIELSKAKKKGLNVWHVLGRIAAEDEAEPAPRRVRAGTPAALEISR